MGRGLLSGRMDVGASRGELNFYECLTFRHDFASQASRSKYKVEAFRGLLGVMSEFGSWSSCLPPDTGTDADVGAYGPWTDLMKESSSPSAAVPSHRPQARQACVSLAHDRI